MSEVTMSVETSEVRDGNKQLNRRWAIDDPSAAMLLVHGIGEHSGRYLHVGDYFASRNFDVAAFDNRGFGQSGGRRGHVDDFEEYLVDIEDQLDARRQLGVPVVLFGHSLGGLMVASYLTGNRPQPDLAVLSAPALAAEVPRWQRIAAPILGRVTPKLFVPSEIDGVGLSRDEKVQKAYVDDPLLVAGATAGMGHQVFTTMKATVERLSMIKLPTYVLHGDADPVVPPGASAPMKKFDNVTYRSWKGLRHECHNEPEHEDVLAEVADWIDARLRRLA